jgi:Flp pilus assembly protein TadD
MNPYLAAHSGATGGQALESLHPHTCDARPWLLESRTPESTGDANGRAARGTTTLGACFLLSVLVGASACGAEPKEGTVEPPKVTKPDGPLTDPEGDIPSWKARWELARVLNYVKKSKESEAEYRKLLKEKPDLIEAKVELAATLFWQGQKEEGVKLLEGIAPAQLSEEGQAVFARLLIAQGRSTEAIPLLKTYLEKNPDDDALRVKYAEALSWNKSYPESLAEYQRVLKKHAQNAQIRRRYGMVLMWAGKYAEAAEELKKTLAETGNPP